MVDEKSKKKIRVFPLIAEHEPQPRLRTNETYDSYVSAGLGVSSEINNQLRDKMHGHVTTCSLRKLRYFDVGESFLSDSLHNVYHGVMVSIRRIFLHYKLFDQVSAKKFKQDLNIKTHQ